jgi:hypothetical protein
MPVSLTTLVRVCCSVFSAALFVASCSKADVPIVQIDIVDRSGKLDKTPLETRVAKAADRFRGFSVRDAKKGEDAHQLTVRLMAAGERPSVAEDGGPPREGMMRRGIAAQVTLSQIAGLYSADGAALVSEDVPADSKLDVLAEKAIDEAMASLSVGVELAKAKDEEILKAIDSSELGVKKRAVTIAGDRKLKDAVPKLMALVRDEKQDDQDLVLKAIGALVAIGDARAAGALIDAGRNRSSGYLSQILYAVATLGGKEAEAYLFTVSNGHADPEIRKRAGEALSELERRKKTE